MTTYSLTGITINFNDDEAATTASVESGTEVHMFVPEGGGTSLRYTATGFGIDGETPVADIDDPSQALVSLNGGSYPSLTEEFILQVVWNDNGTTRTSIVFGFDELMETDNGDDYANRMHVFQLSGDPLPNITSAAAWDAFDDSIQSVSVPGGAYGPNQDIALSTFFPSESENDQVAGTQGDDEISTGAGDDTIYTNGGDDTVNGGAERRLDGRQRA